MKIALCLSGYFDSLTDLSSKGIDGFDHLKRHVFSKGDVDVYIHSWDKKMNPKLRHYIILNMLYLNIKLIFRI